MLHARSAAVAAFLAIAAACGSDSTTTDPGTKPPPAASVASVDLTPQSAEVVVGHTAKLTATPRDAAGNALNGRTVSWSSSNANILSVDNTGLVTGVAVGNATITASSEGKTASAAITVKPDAPAVSVATVSIAAAPDTIEAWDATALHASMRDAKDSLLTGRAIRWTTSNPAVAIIDSVTGMLTGIDRGAITVTATSEGKVGTQSHVIVIKYRSISAGTMHACDLASGGIAWCWGLNGAEGRIGSDQLSSTSMSSTPVKVPGNLRFTQLATFGRHTCGLTSEGKAYCWGYNGWGGLGTSANISQSFTPVAVAGNLTFRSITAGSDHTCAVTLDYVAYCWGNNDWRQLGTGTSAMSATPVAVTGGAPFVSIAAGAGFTCGVAQLNGVAYCWGANSIGQTGDGKQINYGNVFVSTPQQVVGGLSFKSLSLGNQYACGVTTAGQAYCWGSNSTKLGAGTGANDSSSPLAVVGGYTFRSVSAGALHACGVTTSDAVYCWGRNGNGELGVAPANGSSASAVPVRAGGNFTASEVSAAGTGTGSSGHSCAISVDRLTAYCFGRNDVGQLGNGTTTSASVANATPVIIVGQKPL
jgi:alpha-tubulin suppressor-like RCC1 family protein